MCKYFQTIMECVHDIVLYFIWKMRNALINAEFLEAFQNVL